MDDRTRHAELDGRRADLMIGAALRGETAGWDSDLSGISPEVFLARARFHGVGALLLQHLPDAQAWPAAVRKGLRQQAISGLAFELRHRQVLVRVLNTMERQAARPLFMKGTALAYAVYDRPEHRSRGDSDVIVPPDRRAHAHAALTEAGFREVYPVTGIGERNEACYKLVDEAGIEHVVDLHWAINDSALLASLFSHEELSGRATALPRLGSGAWGLGPVDALLLACMHRQAHAGIPYYVDGAKHFSADRLIWLYDVVLLAKSLTTVEWEELAKRAGEKGLARVCRDGLAQASAWPGVSCPPAVLDCLAEPRAELPEAYLHAGWLRREWLDLRFRDGLAAKLRYLARAAFPSPAYMHAKYPDAWRASLPWLYLRRASDGVAKRARWKREDG